MTWADQSGNGRNGIEATAANQPVFSSNVFNCNPALTFDGTNVFLTMQNLSGLPTGASQLQQFAVANHTDIARDWNHIFTYGTGNTNQIFGLGKHSGTANSTAMFWTSDAISTIGEFASNNVVLLDGKYTGTHGIISTYGAQRGSITFTANKTTAAGYIGVDPVINSSTHWLGNIRGSSRGARRRRFTRGSRRARRWVAG